MKIRILLAPLAVLGLVFALAGPADAAHITYIHNTRWVGIEQNPVNDLAANSFDGAEITFKVPTVTTACGVPPTAVASIWVGMGAGSDNIYPNTVNGRSPFTQNGVSLTPAGVGGAWYEDFLNGTDLGEHDIAFTATPGQNVTIRNLWNAAHTDLYRTWKNLTTGQYVVVHSPTTGSLYLPSGEAMAILEPAPQSSPGVWQLIHFGSVYFWGGKGEQVGSSVDSRGVPIESSNLPIRSTLSPETGYDELLSVDYPGSHAAVENETGVTSPGAFYVNQYTCG